MYDPSKDVLPDIVGCPTFLIDRNTLRMKSPSPDVCVCLTYIVVVTSYVYEELSVTLIPESFGWHLTFMTYILYVDGMEFERVLWIVIGCQPFLVDRCIKWHLVTTSSTREPVDPRHRGRWVVVLSHNMGTVIGPFSSFEF